MTGDAGRSWKITGDVGRSWEITGDVACVKKGERVAPPAISSSAGGAPVAAARARSEALVPRQTASSVARHT